MRYLAAILITLGAACATEDDPEDTTGRGQRDPSEYTTSACHHACQVAFGLCEIASPEDKDLLAGCTQRCPFTVDQLHCYATASCGSEPTCE